MRKAFVLFCALFALAACNTSIVDIEEPVIEGNQELKINFTVSRADAVGTKATVKTGWANDDVVFVFFDGIDAPKYLELKRNGVTWDATKKNSLSGGDFVASGTMTAVYLPYGSDFTVAADESGAFTMKDASGADFSGHFYICEKAGYTFDETTSTLSGTIHLTAAAPVDADDKLVHFDVSGYNASHTYSMYQDHMKPISLTSIAADGTVVKTVGSMGGAIPGYVDADNSIVSFSGVLDKTVVGSDANYWISIRDTENGKLYYRNAGTKKISGNMYIGLGNLTSAWSTSTPGVFSVSGSKTVNIASSNLSYRGSETNKWQLMKYPWTQNEANNSNSNVTSASEIGLFGWATSGYKGINPWRYSNDNTNYGPSGLENGQNLPDGSLGNSWDWGINNSIYEFGGENALTGWRTATLEEWAYLFGFNVDPTGGVYEYDVSTYDEEQQEIKIHYTGTTSSAVEDNSHPRYNQWGRAEIDSPTGLINGVILIPDSWSDPQVTTNNAAGLTNQSVTRGVSSTWTFSEKVDDGQGNKVTVTHLATNHYTMLNWNKMEASGAIFLPACGHVNISEVVNNEVIDYTRTVTSVNAIVRYWTRTAAELTLSDPNNPYPSTFGPAFRAYNIDIQSSSIKIASHAEKSKGRSVRLVHDL